MLDHYIIQALRSFWRFRVTAAVNLLGLVLAVVCFIATYLYLDSLIRADRHFPKSARTWVITQELWNSPTSRMIPAFPTSGPPVAAALRADFPGLEAVGRAVGLGPQSAATEDRKTDVFTAAIDPEFLQIFDLDFKAGDPKTAVSSDHSAILTERAAERLFGTTQVLGRRVLLQTRVEVTITGVIAGISQPSHMGDDTATLRFDLLVPMRLLKEMKTVGGIGVPIDGDNPTWGNDIFLTYVLFPADGSFTPQEFISQLGAFAERRANRPEIPIRSVFGAVPVSGIQLAYWNAFVGTDGLSFATMIFLLDVLILGIACVNYANLAVAIATTRAKEIGVRKVLGATSGHLIRQYLVEAAMLGIAAIVIVVLLALLIIEPINRALSTSFTLASLLMPGLWLMVTGLLAAISVMGGLYPALALSHVRPVDALRSGNVRAGPRFVPTVLVGVQFAAASFLLVVAFVMAHQNTTLKTRALQAGRDPVVVLATSLNELNISFDSLREELLRDPRIKAVSSVAAPPWQNGGSHVTYSNTPDATGRQEDTIMNQVGPDFFGALGLKMLAGRTLDLDRGDEWRMGATSTRETSIVIDRSLATALGWSDPNEAVNRLAYAMNWGRVPIPFRVVGVVEDGYPRLVGPNTASNMYVLAPSIASMPLIRIAQDDVPGTVKYINGVWDSIAPKASSRLEFMDDLFNVAYAQFTTINSVLNALAVFAFFIAVMGLCGLAIHVTSRRQREIGIRKTLGATVRGVVTMLLIDFAKPVLIANVIAWPFAWFVGQKYMEQFTHRDGLTVWPFLLSLVITVGVAWAAVGYQALRAATVKPANVLYAQ
jgi:putative ABC transport system permease protein